jgi:tartrate dehydratase beta subunit/fumarate hydratase class I family protein
MKHEPPVDLHGAVLYHHRAGMSQSATAGGSAAGPTTFARNRIADVIKRTE